MRGCEDAGMRVAFEKAPQNFSNYVFSYIIVLDLVYCKILMFFSNVEILRTALLTHATEGFLFLILNK